MADSWGCLTFSSSSAEKKEKEQQGQEEKGRLHAMSVKPSAIPILPGIRRSNSLQTTTTASTATKPRITSAGDHSTIIAQQITVEQVLAYKDNGEKFLQQCDLLHDIALCSMFKSPGYNPTSIYLVPLQLNVGNEEEEEEEEEKKTEEETEEEQWNIIPKQDSSSISEMNPIVLAIYGLFAGDREPHLTELRSLLYLNRVLLVSPQSATLAAKLQLECGHVSKFYYPLLICMFQFKQYELFRELWTVQSKRLSNSHELSYALGRMMSMDNNSSTDALFKELRKKQPDLINGVAIRTNRLQYYKVQDSNTVFNSPSMRNDILSSGAHQLITQLIQHKKFDLSHSEILAYLSGNPTRDHLDIVMRGKRGKREYEADWFSYAVLSLKGSSSPSNTAHTSCIQTSLLNARTHDDVLPLIITAIKCFKSGFLMQLVDEYKRHYKPSESRTIFANYWTILKPILEETKREWDIVCTRVTVTKPVSIPHLLQLYPYLTYEGRQMIHLGGSKFNSFIKRGWTETKERIKEVITKCDVEDEKKLELS